MLLGIRELILHHPSLLDAKFLLLFPNNYLFTGALEFCQKSNFDVLDWTYFGVDVIIFFDIEEAVVTQNYVYMNYGCLLFYLEL
jgi:hypothetical protein